jgi:hypothetical protein
MSDIGNLVDKHHNGRLQDLCGIREVPDVTKPIDGIDLLSRNHRVHVSLILDIGAQDLSSGFTET